MADFEVRDIQGQKVFVREIARNFWLVNDVFVQGCDEYVLDDDEVAYLLTLREHPVLPYKGAENDCVASFLMNPSGDTMVAGQFCLSDIFDKKVVEEAHAAYEEYRSWSGV